MKYLACTLGLLVFRVGLLTAQTTDNAVVQRATMLYRFNPHPFITEYRIVGTMQVESDRVIFAPKPCPPPRAFREWSAPCFNDQIRPLDLPFERIKSIRRRNIYLLIPSRLYIREHNGKGWLFATYQRKEVMRAVKAYQATHQIESITLK
jgi:hypothetical protein